MSILYAIKRGNKYLKDIEPNKYYSFSGTSPTMGNRHTYNEYDTIWGLEPVYFEHLTLCNYIRILTEEYRWQSKKPLEFKVIPLIK